MNPRSKTIEHFFEHYKDLEEGKWVEIRGWGRPEAAKAEISACIATYRNERGQESARPVDLDAGEEQSR